MVIHSQIIALWAGVMLAYCVRVWGACACGVHEAAGRQAARRQADGDGAIMIFAW
jgi:hypothetical protein